MKIETMRSRPFSRASFERNLFIYSESMKQGRIFFHQDISMDGLLRVRMLPNGRIDLLSIDEMTRLNANMHAEMSFSMPLMQKDSSPDEESP
ncbi:AVAST type 1 anti-phage system protein Avs1c [Pyxidicoccus caerfyrddinensis]|uniref:AVAST type 1 anti-phage system protein Avs1c n=1 Tax=Pyxidicoccus caerfyrddinensis TaxID=2709663 RepID=UPI0013DBC20B|nr:AVAST type 1 anti-phage system protein Avs1c [Pyxidicoccus caerfyrddinensis]